MTQLDDIRFPCQSIHLYERDVNMTTTNKIKLLKHSRVTAKKYFMLNSDQI